MLSIRAGPASGPRLRWAKRLASTYSAERMVKKYPVGAKVHGFEIKRVSPIPEFSMTAVELSHERTGAKHLHIDRDDKNNVFSVSFKTNPPNSTGVPHILEHTTLCGSEKYPVRDPFFKMLNRSLANFMNAMTGHDYTFYPFATTNKTDFDNLADVYLDATFKPLLNESDFQQEGWRLENEVTEDTSSPLVFKGVVYNEMKGQVSNSSYYYWIKFQESIYPSLNNSGGDPSKMTDLYYMDLVDFHSQNYHPSNARIFTYGSFPLVGTLEKLNEKFGTFGKRGSRNIIKAPAALDSSRVVSVEGPIDPMLAEDKQYKSSITWHLGDPRDVYETFVLKVLANLLIDGHSAPLYQGLIESGFGDDFSVNTGFESITKINMFSVGLQGLTAENAAKLSERVEGILRDTVAKGFEPARIDAILHQLELGKKMESSEFGMNILYSLTPAWVNDVDPFEMLQFEDTITKFKENYKLKGTKLFTDLISEHLLDKPTFTFSMVPSAEFQDKLAEEESLRLSKKTKNLSDEDREFLYNRGLELQKSQNAKEDLSSLPTLTVNDIPLSGDSVSVDVSTASDHPVYKRSSPKANGLTYFRAHKDITAIIPQDLVPFLPLFTECLTHLGTDSKSMSVLSEEIKLYTGGLSASVGVTSNPYNLGEPVLGFYLNGVALNQNIGRLFELFNEVLLSTDFHKEDKLSVLIKSLNSDNLNSIISSGHGFAKSFSSAHFSKKAAYDEALNGIKQFQFLSTLSKWNDEGKLAEKVIPKLISLQRLLVTRDGFKIALTCDGESMGEHEKLSTAFISQLPQQTEAEIASPLELDGTSLAKDFIKIPTQVQFSSLSSPGVAYTHDDGAKLQVLSQILTFKRLHREIREKGGAYGGGANYDALNGIFNFYSYRDPNPANSLKVFESTGSYVADNIAETSDFVIPTDAAEQSAESITDVDLNQAKLTIFQRVDSPISVREEGMPLFLYGITNEMKQKRRADLLDVSLQDVKDASEKYLVNPAVKSTCVIGADLGTEFQDWTVLELS